MTQAWWRGSLILISVVLFASDLATGPYLRFPIAFVIPVGVAAWFLSRQESLGIALILVLSRFGVAVFVEPSDAPISMNVLNAAIRLVVLMGLAVLLSKVKSQQRELADRVTTLEGILPICGFCKKIRRPDGAWEQMEAYITNRSHAKFSHTFCEECGREHYGEDVLSSER